MTIDEKEDREKVDDPEVFDFNMTEVNIKYNLINIILNLQGIISGPSLSLNNIPLGPALPQIKDKTILKYYPLKIDIIFKVCYLVDLKYYILAKEESFL